MAETHFIHWVVELPQSRELCEGDFPRKGRGPEKEGAAPEDQVQGAEQVNRWPISIKSLL